VRALFFFALMSLSLATPSFADDRDTHKQSAWLQLEYKTSSKNSDGQGSSNSGGRQALIETILDETPDGVVIQYDLPRDADGKANSGFWYFPARVIERPDGALELLDEQLVGARIDQWLEKYKISKEACGMWSHGGGFSFKVDCDPQSILDEIDAFDLRIPNLQAGAVYSHPLGAAPGTLETLPPPRQGWRVTFAVDQDKARAAEADRALILAQMLGTDLARQQAIRDAEKIKFQGTIAVIFDLDLSGTIVRKTERSEISVTRPNEDAETKTSLTTVTRMDMETALAKFKK